MRFKFIGQQKDWAFSFEKWGHGVTDYVTAVLKMGPKHHLALCDEARQMAKNISKRVTKGLSTSETQAQPTKAPRRCALLKEGHAPA